MKKKNKIIILTSIITSVLIVTLGITYAFFTYQITGTNSKLVVGDIYMHYNETNQLTLESTMPFDGNGYIHNTSEEAVNRCVTIFQDEWGVQLDEGETWESFCDGTGTVNGMSFQQFLYEELLPYGSTEEVMYFEKNNVIISKFMTLPYFEFTIDGKNTTLDKDIYYQIQLSYGSVVEGKTERIRDDLLRFSLVEYNNGVDKRIFTNYSFNDLNNKSIWANRISAKTNQEISRTYRLYMWIDNNTKVCSGDLTSDCDYYLNQNPNWNDVYASIKVNVDGDFVEKEVRYNVLKNNLSAEMGVSKESIKKIEFLKLNPEEINTIYQQATFKSNGLNPQCAGGNIKIWLENDTVDTTKYIMYIASDETIYFPDDCSSLFEGFTSLQNIYFSNIDTSNVTDMHAMFAECSSLTSLYLSGFNTSKVTDMRKMFYYCNNLTNLNVSSFDTSNVTDMSYMFDACNSLTNLNVSNFNTSKLTDMRYMFYGCSSLTNLDVSNFNTSKVTSMRAMFSDCSLTSLDLSSFDTSNVADMEWMFQNCIKLATLDISSFDTSKVTNMRDMFYKCSSLTSLDVSSFDTSNVTDMYGMFRNCNRLANLDLSSFDTSRVTNMESMFSGCSKLASLNISNFTFASLNTSYHLFNSMSNDVIVTVKSPTEQSFILSLSSTDRPGAWTTSNVVVKG